MKTVKLKLINVVNNVEFIKKIDLYIKIDNARKFLMDSIIKYFGLINHTDGYTTDRLYPIYNALFLERKVNDTYPSGKEEDVWNINTDLIKEFNESYIDPLIEKLMVMIKRFKTAIESSDEKTINDITGMSSCLPDDVIDKVHHSLEFISNSYDVYKSYKDNHNVQTIFVGVNIIKYILDQIILRFVHNIEYKTEINEYLYKYTCGYCDLLDNLLHELEVDFYAGDEEE